MATTVVKVHPITYPNFVHIVVPDIPGQAKGDVALNVGDAFPTDEAAAAFWDEAKAGWVAHCRQRRSTEGKS